MSYTRMRHNIYVRWSAGIILIGHFDLQTQHHWSLIGTNLSYMDGALWIQELQYYGIICQTTLDVHPPYSYLKDFWKHFSFKLLHNLLTVPCTFYPSLVYIFFFLLYFFIYVYLFPIFIGICDDLENTLMRCWQFQNSQM